MAIEFDIGPIIDETSQFPIDISGHIRDLLAAKTLGFRLVGEALEGLMAALLIFDLAFKSQIPVSESAKFLVRDSTPGQNVILTIDETGITLTSPATGLVVTMTGVKISQRDPATGRSFDLYTDATGGKLDLSNAAGTLGVRVDGNIGVQVAGNTVLKLRGAAVAKVTQTAGATYTGTEQAMLNALKTAVNDINDRLNLNGHGAIAGT